MADLGGDFDSGAISDERELLPDGEVLLQIFESELIKKSADTAQQSQTLTMGWEIVSGPLQGRKLWTRENIQHSSAQAQEIGQRNFKRIIKAAFGQDERVRNSDLLHFKPMLATIITKPARTDPSNGKTYDPSNELRGWKFYGPTQNAPAAPAAVMTNGGNPGATAAPAAKASVPWPTR